MTAAAPDVTKLSQTSAYERFLNHGRISPPTTTTTVTTTSRRRRLIDMHHLCKML
jgi:hypothetical protein